jgi:hypothetical protein
MKYSVAFKLWLPCGYTGWVCQYVVEASNEDDALFEAEMILQRDKEFEGYKIIGNHISEYEKNDEYRFEEKRKLWEAEENNQKAPAEIARALNRIADKLSGYDGGRSFEIYNTNKTPWGIIFFNAISTLILAIIVLLRGL